MTTTSTSTRLGLHKITARIGAEVANTDAAYQDLPEPLRAFADTLWAVHTNEYDYAVLPGDLDEAGRARRAVFGSVAGGIPVGVNGQQRYSVKGDAWHCTPVVQGGRVNGPAYAGT